MCSLNFPDLARIFLIVTFRSLDCSVYQLIWVVSFVQIEKNMDVAKNVPIAPFMHDFIIT